jgi:hypothetical protein
MIIKSKIMFGKCETVGQLLDALQGVDRFLPLQNGLSQGITVLHIKGAPQEDECPEYTEWVEFEDIDE